MSLRVTAHGSSFDERHARQQWLDDPNDVALDYMERYRNLPCVGVLRIAAANEA